MSGKLAAWTIEISQFFIKYKYRKSVRLHLRMSISLKDPILNNKFNNKEHKPRVLFVDGLSTVETSGTRVILISPERFKI